jgi:2-amino-4-hydroxy-6-hydroxymethyldihydropteridine diphosphokinase
VEKIIHSVYLSLGSNLGDKLGNINNAIQEISNGVGDVQAISSPYFSKPQGFISENDFVNNVIRISTNKSPMELLQSLKSIETRLGRVEKSLENYSDRTIDIDIIFFDHICIDSEDLVLPHPKWSERDFVYIPLNEITTIEDRLFLNSTFNYPNKDIFD